MKWFSKKVTLFKKKDRETWQKIKTLLKDVDLKGIKASHYSVDSLCACGCGSKIDPRNFGVNVVIDRDVYFIDVKETDFERAKNILTENGIEAIVDDDLRKRLGSL